MNVVLLGDDDGGRLAVDQARPTVRSECAAGPHSALLRLYVPKFFGTLKFAGAVRARRSGDQDQPGGRAIFF